MSSEPVPQKLKWGKGLKVLLSGMCMGACDLVPGISGGTVAFLMGFYSQLLDSLKSLNLSAFKLLLQFKFQAFFQTIAWSFLLPLLAGIIIAMASLAQIFDFILNHESYRTFLYAGFCGLIAASAYFCLRQIKHWQGIDLAMLCLGLCLASVLTGPLPQSQAKEKLYEVRLPESIQLVANDRAIQNYVQSTHALTQVRLETLSAMSAKKIIDEETWIYDQDLEQSFQLKDLRIISYRTWIDLGLIGAGMLAISAMLLPGISGSYVLTVLGVYPTAIAALADFIKALRQFSFDSDAFCVLLNLGLGIVLGGLLFCRLLSWLLQNWYQGAVAFLTGAMLGASRTIWPFWNYQYFLLPLHLEKGVQLSPSEPFMPGLDSPLFWSSLGISITTFGFVLGLEFFASYLRSKQSIRIV
ncbi:putative uncharacterized protein [Parachlamydia acanthamoebae UV-7]|uniref:DUF368 domain-containing protein n=1 Tax=Parachlamydia acanthamoebae (strain UV7) TaxID=765952 RepID=F8L0M1_PARAV|nr:DUF368 domain-containing protein [Parachlamydia acanthamoebae]CCB86771.1 putative uncharacterized protein [Parachlamydia acanthamoebae UV-7]